ncbi:DsbA family protein [Cohaesibacter haloalkalitolerans]|uniref:DsbA family protein n=1 Tax=Cohaesibacter haloalkalitolerans TaxID=1162980 RepID=UPI000E64DE10|nr:DsbA family protein [Cohaesibacter haloalkalitolerans]
MALNRRDFLITGAKATAGFVALAALPLAMAAPAAAESYPLEEMLKRNVDLEEISLGEEGAPITVIEYFSMTCSHCAHFHGTTFKYLKEKYIDTGKMRFILREFPLDPLATAGAMLARRTPGGKALAMIDLLLDQQRNWAFTDDPVGNLQRLTKLAGFSQESFEKAVSDDKLLDAIEAVRERGQKEFGINSTPTFFVNGEKHIGALSNEEFDKVLEPLL